MIRRLDREGNGLPAPPVWSSFGAASSKRRLKSSAAPITLKTWPNRPRGLRRSEASAHSIAPSNWPAKSLRMAPMYQPRAKLGLRDEYKLASS